MKYPKNIQNRIKRIEGQVGGVKRMMIAEESNTKVMTQLQAVISSLESMKNEMVKQQMKESIVSDVKKTLGIEE
jgi:DNA-binding FrmR family transcriptional regulator